jgi:hypothetical protein
MIGALDVYNFANFRHKTLSKWYNNDEAVF